MPAVSKTRVPQRQLVTLAVAADHAAVSDKTIRRRIADGSLTGYRMGPRLIRVDLNELDALLAPIPATTRLAEHVARVVAEAPPLTPAQRDRIAILLRGGAI